MIRLYRSSVCAFFWIVLTKYLHDLLVIYDNNWEDNMEGETGSDSLECLCAPCLGTKNTTPATVYCRTCKQFQCSECQTSHTKYPGMFGHDIVEADTVDPEHVVDLKVLDICSDHGKMLEFLCKDHDILCCITCAITEHRPCGKILEIKKIISTKGQRATVKSLKLKLEDHRTREKSLSIHIEKTKANTLRQIDTINERVKHIERQVKDLIEKSKQKLNSETTTVREELLRNLEQRKETAKQIQLSTTEASKLLEQTVKHGDPIKAFIYCHHLRRNHFPRNTAILVNEERNKIDNELALKLKSTLQAFLDSEGEQMNVSVIYNNTNWKADKGQNSHAADTCEGTIDENFASVRIVEDGETEGIVEEPVTGWGCDYGETEGIVEVPVTDWGCDHGETEGNVEEPVTDWGCDYDVTEGIVEEAVIDWGND